MKLFLCALGLVLVLEGIPYFALPGKVKTVLMKIYETPEPVLRGFGFAAIVVGMILVYFGTR
ncbi:MAG: DUF2065 domain-containing protein [Syntrophales bacterium]